MLRKISSYLVLITCVAFGSCDEIEKLLTFTVSDTSTLTIPQSGSLNQILSIVSPEVSSSATQEFQNNNTSADLVKDVKLTQLKLEIKTPEGTTFGFLKEIEIYISTGNNDEILLASLDDIPETATSIALVPTKQKLDRFLKASAYQLRTAIVTRGAVEEDTEVQVNLKFKVTADPL